MNASDICSELQGQTTCASGSSDLSISVATFGSGRQYRVNRRDWRWSDPMLVTKHPGGGTADDGTDRKPPIAGSVASSLCTFSSILPSGFPSDFSQNSMGIFNSSGCRGFVNVDSGRITPSSELFGVLSSSGMTNSPGISPAGDHLDMRSSFEERRREYFGLMDTEQKCLAVDSPVKRENVICGTDGRGTRIGLNLGVRTYFSTEETASGRFGKRHRANSPSWQVPTCQAEGCRADLSTAKHYHRRHKVCELHSKAPNVIAAGRTQRFCQQCSRFHLVSEFDEGKRSCRKRLADHNRRRRKPQPTTAVLREGASASIHMKNRKLLPGYPKKSSSSSSLSVDTLNEVSVLAGNNSQLQASGGFKCSPAAILNVESGAISVSGAPSPLSDMLKAQPAPLMIENAKLHVSMLPEASQGTTVYHQGLHSADGHTVSDLSLSNARGGVGHFSRVQGSLSGEEPSFPWLSSAGSNADVSLSVTGSTLTHQFSFPEKGDRRSNQRTSCTSSLSTRQDDARSKQDLLQRIHSRTVGVEDWIIGGRQNSTNFASPSLSDMPRRQTDVYQFMSCEKSTSLQSGSCQGDDQGLAVKSSQRHGNHGDVPSSSGPNPLFPELQALRHGTYKSSVYDSQHHIL